MKKYGGGGGATTVNVDPLGEFKKGGGRKRCEKTWEGSQTFFRRESGVPGDAADRVGKEGPKEKELPAGLWGGQAIGKNRGVIQLRTLLKTKRSVDKWGKKLAKRLKGGKAVRGGGGGGMKRGVKWEKALLLQGRRKFDRVQGERRGRRGQNAAGPKAVVRNSLPH